MTDAAALPPQNPLGGPVPTATLGYSPDAKRRPDVQAVIMPVALLLLAGFFAVASPDHNFIRPANVTNLAIELSGTAVLALGMLLVILPGHIDLAAGSAVGLFGSVAAVLVANHNWSAPAALLAATGAAIGVYWAIGALIVFERVPAFITTLGGMLLFRGIQWRVIDLKTVAITRDGTGNLYSALTTFHLSPAAGYAMVVIVFAVLGGSAYAAHRGKVRAGVTADGELAFLRVLIATQVVLLLVVVCNGYHGLPLPVLILGGVAVAVHVVTRHTPFGRYLYAIGGNEEAAVVSGVPVAAVTIAAFAVMGLLVAVTAFLQTAYTGVTTTTVGENMELDAIAACVIGGTSLRGGRGDVGRVIVGALVITVLINGMTLMAVGPEAKYMIRGGVLVAAVWADVRFGKR